MIPIKKKIVVLISGSGTNMLALAKAAMAADYPGQIVAVISDRQSAQGIAKAKELAIPTHIVERRNYATKAAHEDALLDILVSYQPDLICLAGYMRLLTAKIITPFFGKILNIHPSLLPLFPGLATHQKALAAGMKIAGCTVHLVNEGMDEGKILAQAAVPIAPDDDEHSLAARVLTAEHLLYPLVVRYVLSGIPPKVSKEMPILSL